MRPAWKSFALGLLLAAATSVAFATAQAPDELVYKGQNLSLETNPLAAWLSAHPNRKLPEGVRSSGNWRGYVATWQVDKGALWLQKVSVMFQADAEEARSDRANCARAWGDYVYCDRIRDLFPDGGPVRADWFTGTLIVPTGEMTHYVHMGYGSTYSRYLVVWVKAGTVVRDVELTEAQFNDLRREKFEAFKKTELYRKQYEASVGQLGKDTENFLYQFYAEQYLSADAEAP
jgi:hypothetical protein